MEGFNKTHTTDNPFFSVITVSFNSSKTIKETLTSVLNQTLTDYEYIIVDGKSTDDTIGKINQFKPLFSSKGIKLSVISEKDNGIYDAMNKGIKHSTGFFISILNSDDQFYSNKTLESIKNVYILNKKPIIFGDLLYFNSKKPNKTVRTWIAKNGSFLRGWSPPHPSTFIEKSVYNKIGYYNNDFYISADYDLLFRAIHKHSYPTYYLNEYLVKMQMGGRSTKSYKNTLIGLNEVYKILKNHKIRFKLLIIFMRQSRKLVQFLFN